MEYKGTITKLQYAINHTDKYHIMYNQNQFYSAEQKRPINMYSLKIARYNKNKGKNEYVEIFKTAQQLHIVLFLRNIWYSIQGKEVAPEGDNIPNYVKFNNAWKEFSEEWL